LFVWGNWEKKRKTVKVLEKLVQVLKFSYYEKKKFIVGFEEAI